MMRIARVLCLPAVAAALIPKCPICVAAYLSVIGIGAGVGSTVAGTLVRASQVATPLVVALVGGGLLIHLGRVWRKQPTAQQLPGSEVVLSFCCADEQGSNAVVANGRPHQGATLSD